MLDMFQDNQNHICFVCPRGWFQFYWHVSLYDMSFCHVWSWRELKKQRVRFVCHKRQNVTECMDSTDSLSCPDSPPKKKQRDWLNDGVIWSDNEDEDIGMDMIKFMSHANIYKRHLLFMFLTIKSADTLDRHVRHSCPLIRCPAVCPSDHFLSTAGV